jgi:hypothetical protein
MSSTKYNQSIFTANIDKTTVESTRTITFTIAAESTGREHRNKFVYNWDNWNLSKFNSNPIVGYQHNVYGDNMCLAPNPDDVIAKATAGIDTFQGKKVLVSDATFEPAELNATAEKVFRKILWGSLNASSVGVLPVGQIKKETFKNEAGNNDYTLNFEGQELIEWSIVQIPADPQALRRSMKNHTMGALSFLQRYAPQLSMNDMMQMRVDQLIAILEGADVSEIKGSDPELNKYLERFKKIKNG